MGRLLVMVEAIQYAAQGPNLLATVAEKLYPSGAASPAIGIA